MSHYHRNRNCSCQRCQASNLMGGGILVTVGVLFLLENYNIVDFSRSWPALLIVIGLFLFGARTASITGHVEPYWAGGPPPMRPAPPNPDQQVKP